jgi:hypothetical protein
MSEIDKLLVLLQKFQGYGTFLRLEIYPDGTMKAVYWHGFLKLDSQGKIVS